MSRKPRLVIPGYPLHIVQRGNNREPTARTGADHERYRDALWSASQTYRCAIHAYVLMTNHVHLLLTPERSDSAARMMQAIGRRYVRYFNLRYARTGTLWEGRYRSTVIDSDRYLLACTRYIDLNPVRAAIVAHPVQYPWSSYRHNASGGGDPLITEHPLYQSLGGSPAARGIAYQQLVESAREPASELIRVATRRGVPLARPNFPLVAVINSDPRL